jgi:CheY-like chemotaxis protein
VPGSLDPLAVEWIVSIRHDAGWGWSLKSLVLVIENQAANAKLLYFLLRSRGLDVLTASSASEAQQVLERASPRLILMDVQLPGVDGLGFTRRLRSDPRWRSTPIVGVTTHPIAVNELAALDSGCNAFVSKPIDARALGDLVTMLIDRKKS